MDTALSKRKNVLRRLADCMSEKWRYRLVRDAIKVGEDCQWYHRLNVHLDRAEPRLDDAKSIPTLKMKAQEDSSIEADIDNIARHLISSLFYFELDYTPERIDGKYVGSGHIFCILRNKDPAFKVLTTRLSACSAQFLFNGHPISTVGDISCYSTDGNFRKMVEFATEDVFTISLKQDSCEPFNISGSPFSVETLIKAQRLVAPFGTPDHRKRKIVTHDEYPRKKTRYH
jgi:hypothetical protein